MKIERQQIGTVEVLGPQGPLADTEGQDFFDLLQERLESANPRLVISLKETPYLDSLALDGLLAAAEGLMGRGMRLKLVAVSPTCREILDLTGLANRFQFFKEAQDAVKSFL